MSLEYLLDRMAIADTLIRGCTAIDTHRPELFDEVFTPDAVIDYRPLADLLDYPSFRAWSRQWAETASENFHGWQHLLSNIVVEIDGDRARTAADLYNPLIMKDQSVIHSYARYHDELIRTQVGWRITHRRTQALREPDAAAVG